MFIDFDEIVSQAKVLNKIKICVAVAQDEDVLQAIKLAYDEGFIEPILVGDEFKIKELLKKNGFDQDFTIVNETDDSKAALVAANIVRKGDAQVLMKGLVNSSDFLKAVLNAEMGLRTSKKLSHLAAYHIPGHKKVIFLTDAGMNVAPTLEDKRDILINAIENLESMGITNPKVAILAANEKVTKGMVATIDAEELVKMRESGIISSGVLEGPIALDVALSPESAKHKSIDSKISGDVDLFLVPTIEAGNILGKSLSYFGKAKMAGLVLGAKAPVILTSRTESVEGKFVSIALACNCVKNKA